MPFTPTDLSNLRLLVVPTLAKFNKKGRMSDQLLRNRMEIESKMNGVLYRFQKLHKDAAKRHDAFKYAEGYYVLTDGQDMLCAALYCKQTIIARWTPPKQRNRGYATELLRLIGEFWATESTLVPVWVTSYEYMDCINARAGWVKDDAVNTVPEGSDEEVTYDHYPAALAARYKATLSPLYMMTSGAVGDDFARVIQTRWDSDVAVFNNLRIKV
jgi:hypothetical protein